MHMGGGPSNLRRVGLDPSAAGQSVGGMSSFLEQLVLKPR
jgi:hypothetical protein